MSEPIVTRKNKAVSLLALWILVVFCAFILTVPMAHGRRATRRASARQFPIAKMMEVTGIAAFGPSSPPGHRAECGTDLRHGDHLQIKSGHVTVWYVTRGDCFDLSPMSHVIVYRDRLVRISGPQPKSRVSLPPLIPDNDPGPDRGPRQAWLLREGEVPYPGDGVVVLTWQGDSGGKDQYLEIVEGHSAIVFPLRKLPRGVRRYPLPKDLLKPGRLYQWSISLQDSIGTWQGTKSALLWLRSPKEQAGEEHDLGQQVVLATAYERIGLLEEAERISKHLVELEPTNTALQASLKRVRAALRKRETGGE
jgi:hypothetical protein